MCWRDQYPCHLGAMSSQQHMASWCPSVVWTLMSTRNWVVQLLQFWRPSYLFPSRDSFSNSTTPRQVILSFSKDGLLKCMHFSLHFLFLFRPIRVKSMHSVYMLYTRTRDHVTKSFFFFLFWNKYAQLLAVFCKPLNHF